MAEVNNPVKGKVAVVTGGGSGIGEGLARRFAAEGAEAVAVLDVNLEAAQRVAQDIEGTGASGMKALAIRADMGQQGEVEASLAEVADATGEIDIFCSNAGIVAAGGLETTADDWQQELAGQYYGACLCGPGADSQDGEARQRVLCYYRLGRGFAYRDGLAFLLGGEARSSGSGGVAVAHSRQRCLCRRRAADICAMPAGCAHGHVSRRCRSSRRGRRRSDALGCGRCGDGIHARRTISHPASP